MRFPILPAALAALLLPAAAARADVTVSSTFGFDGNHVPGSITPTSVEISSSEKEPVELRLEVLPPRSGVGAGADGMVVATQVYLAPGAKKRVTLPVLSGPGGDEWRLRITANRRLLIRHGTEYEETRSKTVYLGSAGSGPSAAISPLDTSRTLIGVLGDPTMRISWLSGLSPEATRTLVQTDAYNGSFVHGPGPNDPWACLPVFTAVTPESAPDSWLCYEGFDGLLWLDPDPESLKDAARVEAVLGWAAAGGRLFVALTPGSRVAGGSPLAAALPATLVAHEEEPPAEVVRALLGYVPRPVLGKATPVAVLGAVTGRVRASLPDGRPLVVEADRGLGSVTVLAFDPRLLRGSADEDRADLLRAIFGRLAHADRVEHNQFQAVNVNLEPVVNHLRKRFLTSPPLLLLVLGLLVYVLAIGPVDYFLLKRKGKLRRTVVTFPLIVVTFTLLAWGASFLLFGGHSGKVRVAWLDLATAPGRDADVLRGIDLLGAYSPTGTTLKVAYDLPREFIAGPWLGSGANWFGQGEGRTLTGDFALGADGRGAATVDVPLRSHRTLQCRFSGEIPRGLDGALRSRGGRRVLEVRNDFKVRVRDLHLVLGEHAWPLGDVDPGGKIEREVSPDDPGRIRAPFGSALPDPFSGIGMFSQEYAYRGRYGGGNAEAFVPDADTPEANLRAREAMARAAMGVTLAGMQGTVKEGGRAIRALRRQGLDLSAQVRAGRPVLVGWCEADPLGALPTGRDVESTVVVLRRVLPTAAGGDGR